MLPVTLGAGLSDEIGAKIGALRLKKRMDRTDRRNVNQQADEPWLTTFYASYALQSNVWLAERREPVGSGLNRFAAAVSERECPATAACRLESLANAFYLY